MARQAFNDDAWTAFKDEARALHAYGLRGDALWARLMPAMDQLYAATDPFGHAHTYEDAVRYLVTCGYLPRSPAPPRG